LLYIFSEDCKDSPQTLAGFKKVLIDSGVQGRDTSRDFQEKLKRKDVKRQLLAVTRSFMRLHIASEML